MKTVLLLILILIPLSFHNGFSKPIGCVNAKYSSSTPRYTPPDHTKKNVIKEPMKPSTSFILFVILPALAILLFMKLYTHSADNITVLKIKEKLRE